MTTTKTASSKARPAPRKLPILPIVGGVVAVALIATILITFSSGSGATETGEPEITGEALPVFIDPQSDAAVGLVAPEVFGADFDGTPVTIENDGRIKVILFIAHWCPHCQEEVPVVQEVVEAGLVPPEIDFSSVATAISSTQDNYPPSEWLEREDWNLPVVVDDAGSSVGRAFGVSAYPFWVFVDDQGSVMGRLSGRIGADNLQLLFAELIDEGTS